MCDSKGVDRVESGSAGAPKDRDDIEITPEMVEAGLVWLYAYSADNEDGRATVAHIIKAALATRFRLEPPV